MEYTTLSVDDRLLIARDRLRGLESDHYRLSLGVDPSMPHPAGGEERLAQLEEAIETVGAEVEALETEKDGKYASSGKKS